MAIYRKSPIILVLCVSFCRAEGGTISGFVKFPGETPPPAMFANADDPACPRGIGQNHLIVQQRNRALKNALVILENAGSVVPTAAAPAQLSFDHCVMSPRVQWVVHGTSLLLVNKDAAVHTPHALLKDVTVFEVELPDRGPPVRRPLVHDGFYKINCDRHLWERAWVYVSENPIVGITDGDGRFVIKDVPPGRYRLRAWHEGWVEKGKDKMGRIEYQPMEETLEVTIHRRKTTEVLVDNLQPTFGP